MSNFWCVWQPFFGISLQHMGEDEHCVFPCSPVQNRRGRDGSALPRFAIAASIYSTGQYGCRPPRAGTVFASPPKPNTR